MKAVVACGVLAVTTLSLFGSGTGLFDNTPILVGGEGARFFDDQGVFLEGPAYVAQLYAGTTSNRLVAVGAPVMFLKNSLSGYVRGGGVELPFIPALTMAWVQIRAWEADGDETFEEAALAGRWTGVSSLLYLLTGGACPGVPAPPAPLRGLIYPGSPIIVGEPRHQKIRVGTSAASEVVASGGVQVRYQWHHGGSGNAAKPIADATNAVFNPSPAATSEYWVQVATSAGVTNSAAATVTVVPGDSVLLDLRIEDQLPRLWIDGPEGLSVQLQYGSAIGVPAWNDLARITLAAEPVTVVDSNAIGSSARFYRGVVLQQ